MQASKADLRKQILDTAEALVRDNGMRGLSMRQIAARIGYSVAALYLQFRNQDDLILHLNGRTLRELHAYLLDAVAVDDSAEASLLHMADAYSDFAHQHPNRFLMAFEHHLPISEPVPDWLRELVDALLQTVTDAIAPLCGPATAMAPATAAAGLWASVHGLTLLSLTGKINFSIVDAAPRTALMSQIVSSYLSGVQAHESVE